MTFDVFISYSLINNEVARNINDKLEEHQFHCFLGRNGLQAKKKYYPEVEKEIASSKLLLVILSHRSIHSKHIHHEVNVAKKLNKKIIYLFLNKVKNPFILPNDKEKYDIIAYPKDENKMIELINCVKKLSFHKTNLEQLEINEQNKKYSLKILFPYISLFITFFCMTYLSFLLWQKIYPNNQPIISLFNNLPTFVILLLFLSFFVINVGGIPSLVYHYTYAIRGNYSNKEGREIKTRAYILSVMTVLFESIFVYCMGFVEPSLASYIIISSIIFFGLIIYCIYIIRKKFILNILQALTIYIQVFLAFSIICSITFYCKLVLEPSSMFTKMPLYLIISLFIVTSLSYLILVYIDTNMRLIFGISYKEILRILYFMFINLLVDGIISFMTMKWLKLGMGITILVIYAILMVFLRGWIHALSSADEESLERENFKKVTSFIGIIPCTFFLFLYVLLIYTLFYRLFLIDTCILDSVNIFIHISSSISSCLIFIFMSLYFLRFHLDMQTIKENKKHLLIDIIIITLITIVITLVTSLWLQNNTISIILNWIGLISLLVLSFIYMKNILTSSYLKNKKEIKLGKNHGKK